MLNCHVHVEKTALRERNITPYAQIQLMERAEMLQPA
jgi:hypothetical protein